MTSGPLGRCPERPGGDWSFEELDNCLGEILQWQKWLQHLASCLLQFWLPPITRSQQGWLRDVLLGLSCMLAC